MLLSDALTMYEDKISRQKKGYQQEKYRIASLKKSPLGTLRINNITNIDIVKFRDDRLSQISTKIKKPISPASVRLELYLLSNLFEICRIEWGLCENNPVKNIRKPRESQSRDRILSNRENKKILSYAIQHKNIELYSIVVIALETAMRQGEILSLKWEHIDLNRRVAHLPDTKNGTKRDVPLSRKAHAVLTRLNVKNTGLVFQYTSSGLKSTWRYMTNKLSIENLHFHDLRHTAITRLFELGTLNMMEIASISGHKSLSMLKRYTHISARKLVQKLDKKSKNNNADLLECFIPYPAIVSAVDGNQFTIRLLDFEGLIGKGHSLEEALKTTRHLLLKTILTSIAFEDEVIPYPSHRTVTDSSMLMVDPLLI